MEPASRDHAPTVLAVGALAFMTACCLHEVVGHGLPYVLAGGREVVFTPSAPLFSERVSRGPGLWIDLGGTLAALIGAALALVLTGRRAGPTVRLYTISLTAFVLFWSSGYAAVSVATDMGDWAQIVAAADGGAVMAWTIGLFGAAAFVLSVRWVWRRIAVFAGGPARAVRLGGLVWTGGMLAAVLGGILDPRGAALGVGTGLSAGALASAPLLFARGTTTGGRPADIVPSRKVWQGLAVAVGLAYALWFGRGVGVTF